MAYNPGYTDVTAAISIAANSTSSGLCTSLGGGSTYMYQLTGTWVGTVQVQITRDGTNWVNITGSNMIVNAATGAYISGGNVTANGIYQVDVTGCSAVRIITTAYTSGPITGSASLTQTDANVSIDGVPTVVATTTPVTVSNYALVTTASTNAAAVKTTAGTLYSVVASNPTATPLYWKLYNKATTAPTVGTDVPLMTIAVPANSTQNFEFGAVGIRFSAGIGSALTGAWAATDTTNSVAGVQVTASFL
jgi:hypothetical protein